MEDSGIGGHGVFHTGAREAFHVIKYPRNAGEKQDAGEFVMIRGRICKTPIKTMVFVLNCGKIGGSPCQIDPIGDPATAGARRSFGPVDRAESGGVVDELHQEAMLLRVAIVDQEPRVDAAAAGLESVPRVPASDPPPWRGHVVVLIVVLGLGCLLEPS